MTTICGHDCDTLRWALSCAYDDLPSCGCEDPKCQAQLAADDPAKLAAIIVELLRDYGRTVRFYDQHEHEQLGSERGDMVWVDERYEPTMIKVCLEIDAPPFEVSKSFTVQKARSFALGLIDSPVDIMMGIEREAQDMFVARMKKDES